MVAAGLVRDAHAEAPAFGHVQETIHLSVDVEFILAGVGDVKIAHAVFHVIEIEHFDGVVTAHSRERLWIVPAVERGENLPQSNGHDAVKAADNLKGPMHTNDAFVICEKPTLGRESSDPIEVSYPKTPGWFPAMSGSASGIRTPLLNPAQSSFTYTVVGTAALTSTNIKIDFGYKNETLQYHIRCRFDKNKSWGRVKNDYILSHEQAHFDIAEIFARKLNKKMSEYKFDKDNYKTDLKKVYQDITREKEAFQDQYDNETDHSRKKEEQLSWLTKIKNMLEELKDYSGY